MLCIPGLLLTHNLPVSTLGVLRLQVCVPYPDLIHKPTQDLFPYRLIMRDKLSHTQRALKMIRHYPEVHEGLGFCNTNAEEVPGWLCGPHGIVLRWNEWHPVPIGSVLSFGSARHCSALERSGPGSPRPLQRGTRTPEMARRTTRQAI